MIEYEIVKAHNEDDGDADQLPEWLMEWLKNNPDELKALGFNDISELEGIDAGTPGEMGGESSPPLDVDQTKLPSRNRSEDYEPPPVPDVFTDAFKEPRKPKLDDDPPVAKMDVFKMFGIYKQEEYKFDSTGEQIGDLPDEANPQWDAHAQADANHTWAMDQGWAGGKPNEDEFHPETGEYGGVGNTAHHVKEWTKGLQEKHGLSLVNDNDEPVDAVYDHHGFDEEPINHTHITDYIKSKTGKTETFPGAVKGEQFDTGETEDDEDFEFSLDKRLWKMLGR